MELRSVPVLDVRTLLRRSNRACRRCKRPRRSTSQSPEELSDCRSLTNGATERWWC
jgi:hypothetical protein